MKKQQNMYANDKVLEWSINLIFISLMVILAILGEDILKILFVELGLLFCYGVSRREMLEGKSLSGKPFEYELSEIEQRYLKSFKRHVFFSGIFVYFMSGLVVVLFKDFILDSEIIAICLSLLIVRLFSNHRQELEKIQEGYYSEGITVKCSHCGKSEKVFFSEGAKECQCGSTLEVKTKDMKDYQKYLKKLNKFA